MNRTIELVKTAYEINQLEPVEMPQAAMAGRSNVGKSSLINCLAERKTLARISSTPGKTRSVNFYLVRPDGFCLVDLPGYGYAKRSKAERAKWGGLIEAYLRGNPWLRVVTMLLDCRLPPQKPDLELAAYLRHQDIPILAVLTKADKCGQRDRSLRRSQWRDILRLDEPAIFFSSRTGLGREDLWQALAKATSGSRTCPECA
ncbi:MAG: YihA family ribosome biogenesis GTP-binding protein [Desulfovibrionaceae bacterium]|nr:YihA family ribosome biogenesis GTP-binding protein [Desulfovibrionaceae bacterium]